MYRTNIITLHVILLIDVYIVTVCLSYIFQILEYYLSVLLSCMCETQMKEEGGRVRIVGGGVAVIVFTLTLFLLQTLRVAWCGVVWPLKMKCSVGSFTEDMAHQLSHN